MSARLRARSVREADGLDASRALQRVLYHSAKEQPDRRFHALYDKVARSDILWRAWGEVRANRGAPGVDGITIGDVEDSGVDAFLSGIATAVRDQAYRPGSLRWVEVPKGGQPGRFRTLGIPTIGDRVVQTAAKLVLEPIFEAQFLPVSYGFRPKRSPHQALEAVRDEANRGADWVLDADLADCFGSLSHDAVVSQVARRVSDERMLKLVRSWLRAGVLTRGAPSQPGSGTPQGSPISPLMCNIALHVLDEAWETTHRTGTLVRYADDLLTLFSSRARAEEARRWVAETVEPLGLSLNLEKTRVVCLTRGTEGFEFLGFHCHKVESWNKHGRWYLQRWPSPEAMATIRARIREVTDRRYVGFSIESVANNLSRSLRQWGQYYRWGNSARKFAHIDSYAHERLAIFASTKHGLPGRNWSGRYDWAWYRSLGVHRLSGTTRYGAPHARR